MYYTQNYFVVFEIYSYFHSTLFPSVIDFGFQPLTMSCFRKVLRAYQDSWHNRCRFLFCCSAASDRNRNSFTDIARLLSDFFRDLDVVPSDVVVGLVLLRKFQKIEQKAIVDQVSSHKTQSLHPSGYRNKGLGKKVTTEYYHLNFHCN